VRNLRDVASTFPNRVETVTAEAIRMTDTSGSWLRSLPAVAPLFSVDHDRMQMAQTTRFTDKFTRRREHDGHDHRINCKLAAA
jgi:hypothetical protein